MAAKWGVLGAGAVGLWIGGRLLAQHPTLQVELVGRREALVEAVKQVLRQARARGESTAAAE
jgi:ketopantoate reductase